MAEVEAICAKLQNKPLSNKDDKDGNCVFFPNSTIHMENSVDDFNARRRKRKTSAPKNILYQDNFSEDQLKFDQTCGALDLRLNQQRHMMDSRESLANPDSDFEIKPAMSLPNFLQNPLMNIFMNNREHMENFKFLNPPTQSNIYPQRNSQSTTDSDSKSEDDSKEIPAMNAHDPERKINFSNISISSNQTEKGFINKVDSSHLNFMEIEEECIKRFSSYEDCKDEQCQKDLLRDHFHCTQCKKTILRREEMIRHSKWHKKREESLQFNFMRFSPNDDCNEFMCTYNGRQTHYHCLHSGCNKIYISTSDVQMHSNFHKKDAAINQEGFQRYRATEFCSVSSCSYHNQRTTHFHCMRPNCKFTFKNKADMDKHKSHHQRNDSLAKEGFKKYIKYEHCDFAGCKFSKLMNHIHCIRSNCDYVVHSSAQINSHRRKHERRVLSNGIIITPQEFKSDYSILNLSKNIKSPNSDELYLAPGDYENNNHQSSPNNELNQQNSEFLTLIINDINNWENSSEWIQEVRQFTTSDICMTHCSLPFKDHFHCLSLNCNVSFKNQDKIIDHCRRHKIDSSLLMNGYQSCSDSVHLANETPSNNSLHYHCKWNNCSYIRAGSDSKIESTIDFNFLQDIYDHFDSHEPKFHCLVVNKTNNKDLVTVVSNESNDESDVYQFNIDQDKSDAYYINGERKRGRPPKYKKNVQIPKIELNDEEILDDESISDLTKHHFSEGTNGIKCGFKFYSASNVFCLDDLCMYYGRSEHYHCLRFRCNHTTDSLTAVNLHRREFHHYMQIDDGYEYFDRSVNCRRNQCQNNRVNNHYHCVRHNCDYSFKRFNTMHQHSKKHLDLEKHKSGLNHTIADPQFVPNAILSSANTISSSTVAPITTADYSSTVNGLFPFPSNPNEQIFYRPGQDNLPLPIIPSLSNNSSISLPSNMNLNLFMNFNNSLSNFHNTIKALMNNNSNCYSMFPPSSKMPRLQLE